MLRMWPSAMKLVIALVAFMAIAAYIVEGTDRNISPSNAMQLKEKCMFIRSM